MNVLQMSKDEKHVFVARAHEIHCFARRNDTNAFSPSCILVPPPGLESEISQIKAMEIGDVPVLVSACDSGDVFIWSQEDLSRPPIRLRNGESSWSLTSSQDSPYLFVGSNEWTIHRYRLDAGSPSEIEADKLVFKGHQHNVPCIDLSPNGKFLASVSVDETVIIWNAVTGEKLHQKLIPGGWGWSCKWIRKRDVATTAAPDVLSSIVSNLSGEENPDLAKLMTEISAEKTLVPPDATANAQVPLKDGIDSFEFYDKEDVEDDYYSDGDLDDDEEFEDVLDDDDDGAEDVDDEMVGSPPPRDDDKGDPETQESASKRAKLSESTLALFADFKNRAEQRKIDEDQLSDYYLVCGSFNDLIVIDCVSLQTVAQLSQALHRPPGTPGILLSMQRLAMMEFIPSMSALVVASQGACSVLLISVALDAHTGLLELRPRSQLPELAVLSPIAGLCIHEQPNDNRSASRQTHVKMSVLFHFGHLSEWILRRPEDEAAMN
eukprot:TRINITY_DN1630_c0_g1_i1.p1 TRINITY_DN1630_c0_g1~~TRINITY_DN1630_c0_g1_i1.p1  ORF type:complete len:492 (+),score=55.87 TRINITY_DN1630_c0_g1_i1:346-1821(+)